MLTAMFGGAADAGRWPAPQDSRHHLTARLDRGTAMGSGSNLNHLAQDERKKPGDPPAASASSIDDSDLEVGLAAEAAERELDGVTRADPQETTMLLKLLDDIAGDLSLRFAFFGAVKVTGDPQDPPTITWTAPTQIPS